MIAADRIPSPSIHNGSHDVPNPEYFAANDRFVGDYTTHWVVCIADVRNLRTVWSEEAARKDLELARKWAKTSYDSAQANRLLDELDHAAAARLAAEAPVARVQPTPAPSSDEDSASRPTLRRSQGSPEVPSVVPPTTRSLALQNLPHLRGVLNVIDCVGKTWRLHVKAEGGDRVFMVTGPNDVQIRDESDEGSLTFSCGEKLSKPVTVYYDPQSRDPKLAGIAKLLDFVSAPHEPH